MVEPTFELVWGPAGGVRSPTAEHASIPDAGELERRLDALEATARAGEPFVAELVDPERGTLAVGLGSDHSVAYFHRADGEPPYLLSHGHGDPEGEPLVFFHEGVWTEFPPEAAIAPDAGRAAMRDFLTTRECPRSVSWMET